MKTILFKWKCSMLLSIIWCSFLAQAQQLTHQVTLNVNDVEITEVNGYDRVRLKDGGFIDNENNAGEPQLPLISINLLLPGGAKATAVTVTATQETQITGSFTVYPVQI